MGLTITTTSFPASIMTAFASSVDVDRCSVCLGCVGILLMLAGLLRPAAADSTTPRAQAAELFYSFVPLILVVLAVVSWMQ